MTSSNNIYLDGVEFKLSEAFMVHRTVELPYNWILKDTDTLQEYKYDFTLERSVIDDYHAKDVQLKEEKLRKEEKKKQERERQKKELAEKHQQFLVKKTERENNSNISNVNLSKYGDSSGSVSSSNPFYNDMLSANILTPQPVLQEINDNQEALKQGPLDVHEFEDENQDPFSNMELKTIDDLKELQDVLKNVTTSSVSDFVDTTTANFVPRIRHHSPTNVSDEVSSKITKRTDKTPNISSVTGASTSPVITTSPIESNGNVQILVGNKLLPRDLNEVIFSSQSHVVLPQQCSVDETTGFPSPVSSHTNLSTLPNATYTKLRTSDLLPVVSANKTLSAPNVQISNEMNNGILTEAMDCTEGKDFLTSSAGMHSHAFSNANILNAKTDSSKPENSYVNVVIPPVPKPRSSLSNISFEASHKHSEKFSSTSYGAVKNKVLANKSDAERAKFEETINKALTSLPQLPKPIKVKSQDQITSSSVVPVAIPLSPDILCGLASDERKFAQSYVSMGFKQTDVIRTMQKYGKNHKEVIDHLCILQRLLEEGFETNNIEEALEVFNGNETKVRPYLTLESQFMAMGFPSNKIKQALLLHNQDQTKALEELMSSSSPT